MNLNDLNSFETRMRSWTPRRPSPALEARLFGASSVAPAGSGARRQLAGWGWLAPAACVAVLALQLALPVAQKQLAESGGAGPVLASAGLSNQTLAAFAPGWAHSARNHISGETFESTNWTTAPSPMRTLPAFLTLTNGLMQ
jgi:anti-sigma-K factor RskA